MAKSIASANSTLAALLRSGTPHVALFTAAPLADGSNVSAVEVSGNAYARQPVSFSVPSAAACSNTNAVSFGPATGPGWSNVTHYGIMSALTGGSLVYFDALPASVTVVSGYGINFAANQLAYSEQ